MPQMAAERRLRMRVWLFYRIFGGWHAQNRISFKLHGTGRRRAGGDQPAHQFLKEGYEVLIATEWVGENEFQIDPGIRRVIVGPTEEDKKGAGCIRSCGE